GAPPLIVGGGAAPLIVGAGAVPLIAAAGAVRLVVRTAGREIATGRPAGGPGGSADGKAVAAPRVVGLGKPAILLLGDPGVIRIRVPAVVGIRARAAVLVRSPIAAWLVVGADRLVAGGLVDPGGGRVGPVGTRVGRRQPVARHLVAPLIAGLGVVVPPPGRL